MSKQRLKEKERDIIRMRREGKSRQEIADTLGFTKTQIKDWVRRYNRPTKNKLQGFLHFQQEDLGRINQRIQTKTKLTPLEKRRQSVA